MIIYLWRTIWKVVLNRQLSGAGAEEERKGCIKFSIKLFISILQVLKKGKKLSPRLPKISAPWRHFSVSKELLKILMKNWKNRWEISSKNQRLSVLLWGWLMQSYFLLMLHVFGLEAGWLIMGTGSFLLCIKKIFWIE